jgi:hypothetical protein
MCIHWCWRRALFGSLSSFPSRYALTDYHVALHDRSLETNVHSGSLCYPDKFWHASAIAAWSNTRGTSDSKSRSIRR